MAGEENWRLIVAQYKVTCTYSDSSKRSFETSDGSRAMREVGNLSYEEDQSKAITLEKDGDPIYSEKIKAYKPEKQSG